MSRKHYTQLATIISDECDAGPIGTARGGTGLEFPNEHITKKCGVVIRAEKNYYTILAHYHCRGPERG